MIAAQWVLNRTQQSLLRGRKFRPKKNFGVLSPRTFTITYRRRIKGSLRTRAVLSFGGPRHVPPPAPIHCGTAKCGMVWSRLTEGPAPSWPGPVMYHHPPPYIVAWFDPGSLRAQPRHVPPPAPIQCGTAKCGVVRFRLTEGPAPVAPPSVAWFGPGSLRARPRHVPPPAIHCGVVRSRLTEGPAPSCTATRPHTVWHRQVWRGSVQAH
ncbi:hypothetical protein J6590_056201 [Homalodisca vitripennis]|nr:hypothetical protein J6590_056201 [Homalodisca vitripennis]